MKTTHILPMPLSDRWLIGLACLVFVALALLPLVASALVVDKLTLLFILIMFAVMWNLLAGYAGLVSVGQQAFVGLGGYAMIRLVEAGLPPFPAIFMGAALTGLAAWVLSWFVLRMKVGEFAIATWVIAEAIRAVVSFDPLIQGETGTSLVALNAYAPEIRRLTVYLLALASMGVMIWGTWRLLHGRIGAQSQAIRDDEGAAASVGISTFQVKQRIYIIASVGCALAGALWLASAITFQPRTAFGVQWSVFMLFMVLVGGLGTFIGPILGALLFFALQEIFGDFGAWYLAGIGIVAIVFALYLPRGLVGLWLDRGCDEPLSMRKRLGLAPGQTPRA
ncbi:branched-chain amino acid ABC transporter permease [Roseinatronobacter alkalisoli]|uniref:Branched-chain amino acid ABC transporter permease n=1 Tax=Roseinatronobacter alkalisoli TaxID=3028235 RepID=A0ABT5T752_9RHOB|nr:branched-chain amino acid ABC transporter permease [Roseinatronobacter sp. HJB301]MDD7970960.1 branched-chain amino acid ABC transporter permease [Roseinatronobacter sp. HJB301]